VLFQIPHTDADRHPIGPDTHTDFGGGQVNRLHGLQHLDVFDNQFFCSKRKPPENGLFPGFLSLFDCKYPAD